MFALPIPRSSSDPALAAGGPVWRARAWRPAWRRGREGLVLVVVLAAGLLFAGTAEGQVLGGEAEVAYHEAEGEYEALRADLDRSFNQFERALEAVDRARDGDGTGREAAFAAFQTVAVRHMALELETRRALERVNATRAGYLQALEDREDELLNALAREDLPSVRQAVLEGEWQRVRREMLRLEPATDLDQTLALRPVPELRVEPTDGPVELREKANFMQDHALSYDSIIGDLDREIQTLEDRERRLRGLQDLQRDLGRFGQDLLPGARTGAPSVADPTRTGDGTDPESGGEGAAEALASLPLADQIQLLRGTRELAVQYREEALAMANVFRERAEQFGP